MLQVGLDPRDKKWVGKYSLGMRQRLGIAQAIMEKPQILLLDEPMNGLDMQGVQGFRNIFLQMCATGTTILLSSHNSDDINFFCDTVHLMQSGHLTKIR